MSDDQPQLIFDLGSSFIVGGYSGDCIPKIRLPNVVGSLRPLSTSPMIGTKLKDLYYGKEALKNVYRVRLRHPVERGIVRDWDDFSSIVQYLLYDEFKVSAELCHLTFAEPVFPTREHREKLVQTLFETFNVQQVKLSNAMLNILNSSKRTTGVVVSIGGGLTQIVPFVDGKPCTNPLARKRFEFGGNDLTEYMQEILTERGYKFQSTSWFPTIEKLKEQLCFVSLDISKQPIFEKAFELSNGQHIIIGEERFRVPEALFQPSVIGKTFPGIHQAIAECISKCSPYKQDALYSNIVIAGGSSLFEGFVERLYKELKLLTTKKVEIFSEIDREFSVWKGCSMTEFMLDGISRQEYLENGIRIVHRKFYNS